MTVLAPPGRVLITRDAIAERTRALGEEIARDLHEALSREGDAAEEGKRIVLLPVLTGAIVFAADLIRRMPMNLSMGLVTVSSYPGASTTSKGARLRGDLPKNLGGRHVVVVDDILDTGQTLGLLRDMILEQRPASLRICVLLRKMGVRRDVDVEADYVGFDIPNEFVVGYGLDHDGMYRNLPDIVAMEG